MNKPLMRGDDVAHAPHPPLTGYYKAEERASWLRSIFDRTASDYDSMESIAGLGTGSWYRRQALARAGLKPGMRVLDVAVGTGLVARQAATLVGDPTLVTGMDPSTGMLESAKVPAGISLVEGKAESIPFPDGSFDFISMGYALRHISDLSVAFAEFFRVLRPGGRLCILEVTRPEGGLGAKLLRFYLRGIVPTLARLAARQTDTPELWRYYWDTIEACARPEQVARILADARFEAVAHDLHLGMFSEYTGRKPA